MKPVSYSEIAKYDNCQRAYYYNFILGLQPQEMSEALSTGVKGHQLLQNFYNLMQKGVEKTEALKITTLSAKNLINGGPLPDMALMTAWMLVEQYIKNTDFKAKPVLVENRFLFPVSQLTDDPALAEVQIGFTPDVVFERSGGFVDVEDAKFIGRAWSKSKIDGFQQAKLYQILLNRMGYKVGRSGVRFFNTKTYKITEDFKPLEKAEEGVILRDFLSGIRQMLSYREGSSELLTSARRTLNNNNCQYCPFTYPCTLEAKGKDASKVFNALFVKRDYDYTQ